MIVWGGYTPGNGTPPEGFHRRRSVHAVTALVTPGLAGGVTACPRWQDIASAPTAGTAARALRCRHGTRNAIKA